jgi:DNA end-binding protein Ku
MARNSTSPRPFWSGVLAFGLVSIPVSLFPANGSSGFSLRMVDSDGTPLRRQYFCEREDIALERDDLVRGYEVDSNRYVIIEDEELEALEPEKTQEIDLSRFVALSEINPVRFERGYFLVPDKGASKAYRLLASGMEEEQRAGIATFVMRGKEHLVTIVAQQGILRAETMRFNDEIRTPGDIGLPERAEADSKLVKAFQEAIKAHTRDALNRDDLTDTYSEQVREYAEAKYSSGQDVIVPASEEAADEDGESNIIDLMQVLKQRLEGREHEPDKTDGADREEPRPEQEAADSQQLQLLSREELYEKAKSLNIPGRSGMSKPQLIEALKAAG